MILFLGAAQASPAPTRWQWKADGMHWQANIAPWAYLVQQLNLLYHHQVLILLYFLVAKDNFPNTQSFAKFLFFPQGFSALENFLFQTVNQLLGKM